MPKVPKNAETFECKKCDFVCFKESNYTRHLVTLKHQNRTFRTDLEPKSAKKCRTMFACECGKSYAARNSLWYHRQRCYTTAHISDNNLVVCETVNGDTSDKEAIMMLVKQNQEFKDLIVTQNNTIVEMSKEVAKGAVNNHITNGNNNVTQTNSNNKTFNLQFFLNETCKDAMNIGDFIKSLQLNLQDLERVGELGYAEGISRMFVRGLNELDVTKRPIHCSDLKRDVLHIKDKDKWEKDNSNQDKLKKAIKDLSNKNIMLFDDWQRENPGYDQYDNKKNDIYLKLMVQAMGPADEVAERRDFGKIIKSIAKTTIVNKSIIER